MSGFYANSKLGNSLFNLELAKRLQGSGVNTYCLCPGFVQTDIGTDRKSGIKKYIMKMFRYFAKTAEEVKHLVIKIFIKMRIYIMFRFFIRAPPPLFIAP